MNFEPEGVIKPSDQNRHTLTVYPSATDPLPRGSYDQYKSLPWSGVMDLLAPGGSPFLTQYKHRVPYFTSGLLSDGEVGEGASKKLSAKVGHSVTNGKARCRNCCQGPFDLMLFDIDGTPETVFKEFVKCLDRFAGDFLCYSTFSHGRDDKPGYRCRLIMPIWPPINADQYQAIHGQIKNDLFDCIKGWIDDSSRLPWQQQGVWATNPAHAKFAFKLKRDKGLALDAKYWTQKSHRGESQTIKRFVMPAHVSKRLDCVLASDLRVALSFIPSRTRYFQRLLAYLKALEQTIDSYELFYDWAWSDPEHQAEQQGRRTSYDPAVAWSNHKPKMDVATSIGATHKLARKCAIEVIQSDPRLQQPNANEAAKYLYIYHRKHFLTLKDQLVNHKPANATRSNSSSQEAA